MAGVDHGIRPTPTRKLSSGHPSNGLGIRFVPGMDGGNVLNSNGTAASKRPMAKRRGVRTTARAGVAFFDHPSNPRHPNAFFVMNKAFGYMSAAPTFREPFDLA